MRRKETEPWERLSPREQHAIGEMIISLVCDDVSADGCLIRQLVCETTSVAEVACAVAGSVQPQRRTGRNIMATLPLSDAVPASHGSPVSVLALFLTFSRLTLSGFGGMLFWARRALVERQRWLTEQEFVDLLALGQLLPGPNVLNLTVMVGYRFAGCAGAAAAVAGFLGWPCLVVIALGVLH